MARVQSFRSPSQLRRSQGNAATFTGPTNAPQLVELGSGVAYTVIDTRTKEQIPSGTAPGADAGKRAAKITIQNVGTTPIYVAFGGSNPSTLAYHPPILAPGTINNDGLGSQMQVEDYEGCLKITGDGSWRAAILIVWADTPVI